VRWYERIDAPADVAVYVCACLLQAGELHRRASYVLQDIRGKRLNVVRSMTV
jgi:hypothetical protein